MKIILFLVCLSFYHTSFSQQGFSTSAGNAAGTTGNASYTLGQIDFAAANNNTMSFGIQQAFDSSKPLPVNIITFTAHKKDSTVLLQWITTQQKECKNFIVERSKNGKEFSVVIAKVAASITNEIQHKYQTTDFKPIQGFNYYRLKIVDNNGIVSYSQVVLIKLDNKGNNIALYPNPTATAVNINIGFVPNNLDNIICEIFDIAGKKIISQRITSITSQIDLSKQVKGSYFMQLRNNNIQIMSLQVIKN
jgi:Secretion system C-terminal sorting domain